MVSFVSWWVIINHITPFHTQMVGGWVSGILLVIDAVHTGETGELLVCLLLSCPFVLSGLPALAPHPAGWDAQLGDFAPLA